MGFRSRVGAALLAGVIIVAGSAGPAAADRPPPTTNPILGPVLRLITPPRKTPPAQAPPPAPPPTAAPAPAAPPGSGTGKRIVYCVRCQQVWLVEENGTVSRTHPVSGKAGVPRVGTYAVFSKSTNAISGSGKVTMKHMVRFARGRLAIGFHSIPRDKAGRPIQTEAQLGTYRSLGCVRQSDASALALWNFAPVGTKVVVT